MSKLLKYVVFFIFLHGTLFAADRHIFYGGVTGTLNDMGEINPKAMSQAVALTAAASGSSGITVADNDNIDFGTGNFALVWKGSLPDWTPGANKFLIRKITDGIGYQLWLKDTNKIGLSAIGVAGTVFDSSVSSANTFIDGTVHEIVSVITRAGTVVFYVDGVLLESISISSETGGSLDNSNIFYVIGHHAERTAGTVHHAYTLNFAPTAAEVLDAYRNGIPESWKDGSQTAQTSGTLVVGKQYIIDNWITNDDFTNVGGANVDGTRFIATGTTPTTWTNSSTVRRAGPTLNLQPENIQNNRWLDATTNYLDATYPTTGWSLTRPIPNQPVLQNLLTNSQFMAMSGSTLENVGSQLVASWTNADYDTFTTTDADITSAIYSTAGTQNADTASITLVSGKLYKIVATLTLNSGAAPILTGTGGVTTTTLSAGANTITFEATAAATVLTMTNTAASNYSCTFTLYEVTPGYVAADTLAPDGWSKISTAKVYREHQGTNTKDGSFYALLLDPQAQYNSIRFNAGGRSTTSEYLAKFKARTVAFGAFVKSSTASDARLVIYDGTNFFTSSFHTGSGNYEWLEVSTTLGASITDFVPYMECASASYNNAYFSQPMLVYGSSIGRGNYQPIVNEVIWLQEKLYLTKYQDATLTAPENINVEAQTNGKIGKGIKAVRYEIEGQSDTVSDRLEMYDSTAYRAFVGVKTTIVNVRHIAQGFVPCDSNGDNHIFASDAVSGIYISASAIQN